VKVAYVKWLDAYHIPGRCSISDLEAPGHIVESAGLLVRNDKKSVAIMRDWHTSESQEPAELPLVIPKVYVLKFESFEIGKKRRKK